MKKSPSTSDAEISPAMRDLSEHIAGALKRPLPQDVLEKTRHHVLDTVAAMVSGSRLLPGKKAIAYVKRLGGTKEACVIGSRFVTTRSSPDGQGCTASATRSRDCTRDAPRIERSSLPASA